MPLTGGPIRYSCSQHSPDMPTDTREELAARYFMSGEKMTCAGRPAVANQLSTFNLVQSNRRIRSVSKNSWPRMHRSAIFLPSYDAAAGMIQVFSVCTLTYFSTAKA